MGKIRENLIHLLGGKTIKEFKQESIRSYKQAKMDTLLIVLNTIDYQSHNTTSKDRLECFINYIDKMNYNASIDYYNYVNTYDSTRIN